MVSSPVCQIHQGRFRRFRGFWGIDHYLELLPTYLAITVLVCKVKHHVDVLLGHLQHIETQTKYLGTEGLGRPNIKPLTCTGRFNIMCLKSFRVK